MMKSSKVCFIVKPTLSFDISSGKYYLSCSERVNLQRLKRGNINSNINKQIKMMYIPHLKI